MTDREKFDKCLSEAKSRKEKKGIGTLQEKTVHAVFKRYYEPDESLHEVRVSGYVADILNGEGIIEIQTAKFDKMRDKLKTFLEEYEVTIVHPIPKELYIIWTDPQTGEMKPRRKSNKRGTPYHIFPELYKIKNFLLDEKLHIKIAMMNVEEIRILNLSPNRRKKSAGRYDRNPFEFIEEIEIFKKEDYMQFIPNELENEFNSTEFAKAAKITVELARVTLNILSYVGAVKKVGKKGNNIIYVKK